MCYRGLIDLGGSTLVSLLGNGDTSGANIRDGDPAGYTMNTMLPSNTRRAMLELVPFPCFGESIRLHFGYVSYGA